MNLRTFEIDGSYFFHRCLGSLNMGDSINNLDSKQELDQFRGFLSTSLLNLWNLVEKQFDQLIFVTDNDSWRKQVTPFRPYFIEQDDTETPLIYKEQRKAKKKESDINYDNFYLLCNEFVEEVLKPNMVVLDVKGLEGDDNILLTSKKVKELGIKNTVFCTDGDLMQTVNDNNILFRNIKSKVAPYGEFVINMRTYEQVFEQSTKSAILGSSIDGANFYKELFAITLKGVTCKRTLNQGINITSPFKIAMIKSICGDKKDNVFPIFQWKKGSKNYKVTEKMIDKALKLDTQFLTESTAINYLTNKDLLMNLLTNLRDITNQKHADLNGIANHLKHNLRLIVLSEKNIPVSMVEEWNRQWESHERAIIHDKFNPDFLKKIDVTIKDNAVNVMNDSLPEGLN